MTSDNWQRAKDIFNSALDLESGERQDYLSSACDGDAALRKKVENLLSSYESDFMELPVANADHGNVERLPAGNKLGRYEIVRLLGAGGMGEVYLARDDQLGRKVAVKVLNEKYESSEANLKRFVQEAKAASALNHPNILTIHEIGQTSTSHYIVSEFVDGKTLREIIGTRKLSLSEVMDISIQIAGALQAAHSAGIVHRDIKPENIIVRDDGYVKVLDFGLAKLLPQQPSSIGVEDETIRQNRTAEGLILGTVKYMSPEQAKGELVDARSDIFSFGVMLYEVIAGRTPFAGASMPETFANLINRDPEPISRHANGVPDELDRIVSKMLRKAPSERYQTMKDLLADLKDLKAESDGNRARISSQHRHDDVTAILETTSSDARRETIESAQVAQPPARSGRARWIWPAAILVLAAAAGAIALIYLRSAPTQDRVAGRSPAYDLYIRGKVKVTNVNTEDNLAAIGLLEQAVAVDPNYAEAWAALAKAYVFRSFNFAPSTEQKKLNEDAEVAVEKALALNPNLPEGHLARGLVLWTHTKRFPHEQAIQAFKRAIELNPDLDEAHQWLSAVYIHIGLFEPSAQEINKTLGINPSNTSVRLRMLAVNYYQGKYEEAISLFKTTPPDEFPANLYRMTADSLVHLGRLKEAETVIDEYLKKYASDEGGNVTSVKAVILAKEGNQKEAEAIIQQSIDIGQGFGHFHHAAYNIASANAIMNKPDEAMKWLQYAADDGFPCYPYFAIDSHLDNLRKDPRFIAFMSKLKQQWLKYKAEYAQ